MTQRLETSSEETKKREGFIVQGNCGIYGRLRDRLVQHNSIRIDQNETQTHFLEFEFMSLNRYSLKIGDRVFHASSVIVQLVNE